MKAWVLDTEAEVSLEQLAEVGVLYWKLDADRYQEEGKLEEIRQERNYKNSDQVTCSRACFGDQYESKLAIFFTEHIHDDEEIRFVLDGSGYFDVRDKTDAWLRIHVHKGDLIVLPAGVYHRFTLDDKEYIKAMRLFVDEPKWTPYNRNEETDLRPARLQFVEKVIKA